MLSSDGDEREEKRRKIVENDNENDLEEYKSSRKVIHPFPDHSQYIFKKRSSVRPSAKETDVYVSRKSNHFALVKRARKMFRQKNEVTIHGLGASIPLAVDISLVVRHEAEKLKITVLTNIKTETVSLVDDFVPKDGTSKFFSQVRKNSAIHIKLIGKKE